MKRFVLGTGEAGDLSCSLEVLVDTRLLIQANSGGGKSWCLRRILEQTHGQVQQLVIDPEGEFASLRERFDYVLAAKHGGDTAADPRGAKLLAERLLELGVSAILDIYELKAHDRIRFVRAFLEALVDAPKSLWHPALVVVDEAHVYCPQKGEAESAGAVIDLATRGRKRGFCSILATQRLSKLHKDAAAECNNKLIGRTGLDVDIARAGDELGLRTKDDQQRLRDLEPGEFFGFGPALSRSVQRVTVGKVQTTHPKAGARIAFAAPPPTDKVKALLPKLSDLPAEAEARQRTEKDLRQEIANLKRELTMRPKAIETKIERVSVLEPDDVKALQIIINGLDGYTVRIGELTRSLAAALSKARAVQPAPVTVCPPPRNTPAARQPLNRLALAAPFYNGSLAKGERKILTAAAQHQAGVTKEQLTVLTGYKRSSRDTYLQKLTAAGLVENQNGTILATQAGFDALGSDFEPLPTGDALREHWMGILPRGERRILEQLVKAYPDTLERGALSDATGFKRSSRDTYLQKLKARKLIECPGFSEVRASEELFG
ncbi:MAG TPA: ATP-binding protein [Candidatus Polarisedimenticolia bacterium]|jgi:hypothetical protein